MIKINIDGIKMVEGYIIRALAPILSEVYNLGVNLMGQVYIGTSDFSVDNGLKNTSNTSTKNN